MWLNYQQLLYFRQIAKQGSISRASEKLNISSPALSMQLKTLEESFGKPLFIRDKNKLIITDFGEYVLGYAEKIFSTGEELLSNLNNDLTLSKVSIGMNSGIPKTMTIQIINHFINNYGETKVQFTEGDDQKLVKDLVSRECDLVITNSFLSDPFNTIQSRFIYESNLSFYGTKKYESLKDNFPESLELVPIILPSLHSNLRDIIDEWYFDKNIKYTSSLEIHDSAVKKLMAAQGIGVVVLAEIGAKRLLKQDSIVHLGDLGVKERFYCSYRTGDYKPEPEIEDLITNIKEIFDEQPLISHML